MRVAPILGAAALMVMLASGCSSDVTNGGNVPPGAPTDGTPPAIDSSPYAGPEATVSVLHRESFPVQHVAQVSVQAPTGGWQFNRDYVEIVDGVAKLFYTLERPGDDEVVTMMVVTRRDDFVSTESAFTRAEVYIHVAKRGVSTLTTNYRLAASE